jgi:hypothetical protein
MNVWRSIVAGTLFVALATAPARSQDQVLVPGEPPLTQRHLDQVVLSAEWILDLTLTGEQRKECERLVLADWQARDAAVRACYVRTIETWAALRPRMTPYQRRLSRALFQPGCLAAWDKEGAAEVDRWMLAVYRQAYKPGSERNPVLADGEPALTRARAERYADYLEWLLDFSAGGGLSEPQRRALQDDVVKDWPKMDGAARRALLETVEEWTAITQLPLAERNRRRCVLRPRLLAQLRAREDEHGRRLLGLYAREQKGGQAARRRQQYLFELNLEGLRQPVGRDRLMSAR